MQVFLIGEKAAVLHSGPAVGVARFCTGELNIVNVVALVARAVNAIWGKEIGAHMLHRGTALFDGARIVERQRLAAALVASGRAHGGGLRDDHGIRSEAAE